jgi:TolB-like protein
VRPLSLLILLAALPAAARVNVAVMYFDNHSNLREYDALSKGMADMLITDLAASSDLQLVERARLEAVLAELKAQRTRSFDPESVVKVGKLLGAAYVVTGAFTGFDPEVRVDVRMIEVQTGRVVVTTQVKGKREAFFELEQDLVKRFLGALSEHMGVAQTGPLGFDAAVKYGQSLDTADRGDINAAATQLAAVVRAAPGFTLGKTRYSELLQRLRSADARHQVALGSVEQQLVDALAADLARPLTKASTEAFFCYRGIKAAYLMWKIERLAGAPVGPMGFRVPPRADRPQVGQLMIELFEHETKTLELTLKSLEAMRYQSFTLECGMALYRADKSSQELSHLKTLGVPFDLRYAAHPMERATALATWVATGTVRRAQFSEDEDALPNFRVLPVMPAVKADAVATTLALLDVAQRAGEKAPAFGMPEATLELELARANVLINAGRREEGLAVLQAWLDQNPKVKAYRAVEEMVESLLGISEQAKRDTEALVACSASDAVVEREIDRIIDAEGGAAVGSRAKAIEARCPVLARKIRAQAAWGMLLRADCDAARGFALEPEEKAAVTALCG